MAETRTPRKVIGAKEDRGYVERVAVRIVLHNEANEVVIVWAEKGNYFKLPGGGVEDSEHHLLAVEREAMEETGCKVRVRKDCIAVSEEWRNELHQLSYCYEARLVENTGAVQLTEDEIADGLKHQWCSYKEAME